MPSNAIQTLKMSLVILLTTGCGLSLPKSEIVRSKEVGIAAMSSNSPAAAKPAEMVKVTGTDLLPGKAYTAKFTLADGTVKSVRLSVINETTASFPLPDGLGLGEKTFDVVIGERKINTFRIVADSDTNTLPIITADASKVCLTETSINKAGDKTVGTKDCSAASIQCSTDGQIGCLTTQRFKAADLTLLTPSKIKSGFSVAGVSGSFDGSEDLDP